MNDEFCAFMPDIDVRISGASGGPLSGTTFAAKDVFDIAGFPTSNGNPVWRETHPVPTRSAPAVQSLLDAGADLVGKTICDEMCYSLVGSNAHYGTPINPRAQERFTGGSSCGSAAAVAGKLVDFALGSDCGGSVRVPAAWCGLFGIRPTHDRVSPERVCPLASSLDTVGWFARDAALFARLGSILLDDAAEPFKPTTLLIAEDMFSRLEPSLQELLRPLADRIAEVTGLTAEPTVATTQNLDDWFEVFRIVQASEIWAQHADWVTRDKPEFGPGVAERMAAAPSITDDIAAPAREKARKDAHYHEDAPRRGCRALHADRDDPAHAERDIRTASVFARDKHGPHQSGRSVRRAPDSHTPRRAPLVSGRLITYGLAQSRRNTA